MQASTAPTPVVAPRMQAPALQPPGALNTFNHIREISERLSSQTQADDNDELFPLRTEFAHADAEDSLIVNSFEITKLPPQIFEYHVDGLIEPPTGGRPGKHMTREKKKEVFDIFVQQHPTLHSQRSKWTQHGLPKLIAISNLGGSRPNANHHNSVLAEGAVTWSSGVGRPAQSYRLRVTLKGSMLRNSFVEYTKGVVTSPPYDSKDFEQALDILVGTRAVVQAPQDHEAIHGDRNTVFLKRAYDPLRRNANQPSVLNAVRCYRYTTKAGMGAGLLNISLINVLSFQAITLDKFMENYGLSGRVDLEKALEGIDVQVRVGQHVQKKTIYSLGRTVREQTFSTTEAGQPPEFKTVETYLNTKYPGHRIKHAQLLAVNVGSGARPCWYAPEQLHILPYQRYRVFPPPAHIAEMQIRVTTRHPDMVRTLIEEEGLRALGLHASLPLPTMTTITAAMTIDPRLLSVPFSKLQAPAIQYSRGTVRAGGDAHWNLLGRNFYKPAKKESRQHCLVRFLTIDEVPEPTFNILVNNAKASMGYGMDLWPTSGPQKSRVAIKEVPQEFRKAKQAGVKVVIFLLPRETFYHRAKLLADVNVGIGCIVMLLGEVKTTIDRASPSNSCPLRKLLAIISMKVNIKCGGVNHTTDAFDRFVNNGVSNVMVMGADGTHPTRESPKGAPTIVALTGTVDAKCSDKRGAIRLQQGRVEVVNSVIMQSMAESLLEKWFEENNKLPALLLYYRDGVSDSQYKHVKIQEVAAIRAAWSAVAAKHALHQTELKITAMVVTKRHSTRLFPTNTQDKTLASSTGNVKPGTVVESGITSPVYEDWFCFSHHALAGTGKPAHYFKICDDWGFRPIEIQAFSFALCFTYQRSTGSVSYPSPTYDADRLCERGRHYLNQWFFGNEIELFSGKTPEQVFDMAVKQFGGNEKNPWHKDVDDTMLWL